MKKIKREDCVSMNYKRQTVTCRYCDNDSDYVLTGFTWFLTFFRVYVCMQHLREFIDNNLEV